MRSRHSTRAPRIGPRMLRSASSPSRSRVVLRVAVPDRIVRMTRFGLQNSADDSGWWRLVADHVESLVSSHLPQDAANVQMSLDSADLEVVLTYDLAPVSSLRAL